MVERSFYRCNICGNIVGMIRDGGGQLVCCGKAMEKLTANTTDATVEKHVPSIERDGDRITVRIGSTEHPMLDEHYIQWIMAAQEGVTQRVALQPGQPPQAEFVVGEGPITVYEYCNLHGLWMTDV